ncbi:TPA: PilW family protein [Stenotrophomonas maltophilia]|uniref:PilW family protein n=1 Tax=Stenotrophomonas maltophilia TaxID=40324 RepID=UPI0015DEAE2D|nr:PilW family protein [Stenotrophomonas maltophilia]MBA0446867.1 prepilin-type N-terminal cleavage/methylation domain-containing protein [Stenotrophomonas maltophilia]HEL2977445.1 PilW family protein [Stenotrophomonas maltophilia]
MSPSLRARGLSLIELMIAMVIGLVLMLGITQIFIASRAASRLSEGAARTQENARFALDFLQRDLRMAGHFGCVNDQAHLIKNTGDVRYNLGIASGSGDPLDFSVPIQGYEAAGTAPTDTLTLGRTWSAAASVPKSITDLAPKPLPGSDILVLRLLSAEGAVVTGASVDGSATTLSVSREGMARLKANAAGTPTVFALADCTRADVFTGSATESTVKVDKVDLTSYSVNNAMTMLYRADGLVYYIAANANNEPALYRARSNGAGGYAAGEELVEGIESMQLLYGLDATTDIALATPPTGRIVDQRVASNVSTATDATATAAWRRVGMVQVGLLARSPQRASAEAPGTADTYLGVLGVTIAPGSPYDQRHRGAYEVSVALRNRLFGN